MNSTVIADLQQLGYADYRVEPGFDPDSYELWVPRDLYESVKEQVRKLPYFVHVHQQTPKLVPAEPGQWVRIYSEYECKDSKSPIGIVTSKHVLGDKTVYGCSYLTTSIGDSSAASLYPFNLSAEDNGGWHHGFLAVLNPNEVKLAVQEIIAADTHRAIELVVEYHKRAMAAVSKLVDHPNGGRVGQSVRWHPPGESPIGNIINSRFPTIDFE